MPKESLASISKRRGLGVLYIVVIASLLWLSIAIYQKKFTDVVLVTLRTDHTGNALQAASDVKERGIIVGSVKSVKVDSGPDGGCVNDEVACVTVTLALDPGKTKEIPENVSARILPKTIFGEQYVSLQIPENRGPAIKGGDTIPQDRSAGALEAQKVLGDLLPLLQAVQPAELNATLTAVAQALQGRGEKLGQTLVQLDSYLKQFNPYTQRLVDDLKQLGQVSDEYNAVAPDLLASFDNLETSARTVIEQKDAVGNLFDTATNTSDVIRSFLSDNEQRLITVTGTSAKMYALLAEYSPEFPCLFAGLNKLGNLTNTILRDNQFNLAIVIDANNQGGYKPGQAPIYVTGYGPNCFGLPDNPQPVVDGNFQIPAKYRCLNDGAPLTSDPCAQRRSQGRSTAPLEQSAIGSQTENAIVNSLIASSYGTTPKKVPAIATMLAAPLLRGQEVTVK
jgi:phospholipid/cholesterol/gamma-HCH transport system substrate-binding protein